MCVCVCVCVCVLGKENPGHIPWGDRLRLISNALYERELSPPSDPSLSLLPSSLSLLLYIHLSLLSHIDSPLQHTPLYFIHLALRIFSQNLTGFHFELVPPLSLSLSLRTCPQHSKWNWNSCLAAKTGVLAHDLSLTMNKITAQSPGIGLANFGWLEDGLIRSVWIWTNVIVNHSVMLLFYIYEHGRTFPAKVEFVFFFFPHQWPISACHMISGLKSSLNCKMTDFRTYATLNRRMSPLCPFNISHLFSLYSWPSQSVTVAMGGQWLLIGVAPDRKQLTAVQEVDNKGHTELHARKKKCVC